MKLLEGLFAPLIDTIRAEARHMLSELEENARRALERMMRAVKLTIAEVALWTFASVFLLAGIMVFLTRFFPTDAVLIGTALILSYLALLIRIAR